MAKGDGGCLGFAAIVLCTAIVGAGVKVAVKRAVYGSETVDAIGTGFVGGIIDNSKAQQHGTSRRPAARVEHHAPPGTYQPVEYEPPTSYALPAAVAGGFFVFAVTGACGFLLVRRPTDPPANAEGSAGESPPSDGRA